LDEASKLFDQLFKGEDEVNDVMDLSVLARIADKLDGFKATCTSRTAKLGFQYMEMVRLLRVAIKAERTSNFPLHLQAVARMLPFFAAAGHNLYAKSARLYLQQMAQLESTHPDVFDQFMTGHNVMRRSECFWGGLSCDLIIEQTLMRTLKSNGGLTRGRGMEEMQRTVWLFSMPSCASVNRSMQSLKQTAFTTSEQHKEASEARQKREHKDTFKITKFLLARNPFESDEELRYIVTGHAAQKKM
jgi:hypothetical protein